jgi:adenylate kinase family enzyme
MVCGPPGSGKSTLARRLGASLGLPITHLDQLHHGPGWQPRPAPLFQADVEAMARRPEWVIDGNYPRTIGPRLATADLVILLDLPRRITLPRLLRRTVTGWGRVRPDSAPGCVERLDPGFLLWAWRWPADDRPALLAALAGAEERTVRLRTPAAVERFAASLRARASAS